MREEEYLLMRDAEDDHWWYRGLRALVLDRIGEAGRVLDVGCGTGGMLARLSGRDAVGVDLSPVALSLARSRGGLRLVRGSACSLPFRTGTFDAVLALDVIYHRDVESDGRAVAECARVARPGGIVAIHAAAYGWLAGRHDERVHGARRHTVPSLRRLVADAGLSVEEIGYRNLLPLPVAILHRTVGRGRAGRRDDRGGSELRRLPRRLEGALAAAGRVEDSLLGRVPLPAGLSVWCLARKTP